LLCIATLAVNFMARNTTQRPQFVPSVVGGKAGVHLPGQSLANKDRAVGKALRERTPRHSHAAIGKLPQRRDPVAFIVASDEDRLENLVPIRHSRMLESPFTYYRGAAAVQANDLAHAPSSGIVTQCCGDAHLLNFGGFATPERKFIFDINDFDETFRAPFEWDLKRLVGSFVLAARWRGISDARARDIATAAALAYRTEMAIAAEENTLDAWYAAVTWEGILRDVKDDPAVSRRLREVVVAAEHHTSEYVFHKLTTHKSGKVRLLDQPPLIYHPPGMDIPAIAALFFKNYVKTLRWSEQVLFARLRFVDAVIKVVGVGSVGTRCYVVLMMGEQNEPVFLQIKEAGKSVLAGPAAPAGPLPWRDRGERVVVGQRLLQAASDIFLGWTKGPEGRHYYVRQLRDMKAAVDIASMNAHLLKLYARLCGETLARAHAKAGGAPRIAGYLGKSDAFDAALGKYAIAYADKTEQDFETFHRAAATGRIKTETSPV
jgi:uncharacterized protein (DUF2252 family)